jgi:transposase
MFLKIVKAKGHTYLQLVHSYRVGSQVKHKIMANLGRFDSLDGNEQLTRLGERFLKIAGVKERHDPQIEEDQRLIYGHIAYQKLWEKWNLAPLIRNAVKNTKIEFNVENAVFLLTMDRLMTPQSKLKSFENQGRYLAIEKMSLHHLYRCLDVLCEEKETIEKELFERRRDIFHYKVDVVFYDVTTFHFESVTADSLRDFGFSKNAKFNEVQVVLGLLVDSYGIPVGFDLFPGNTYEGDTLIKAIEKMRKRFCIGEVIVVSDKGMSNKKNFWRIRHAEYHYIISMRLRALPVSLQKEILRKEDYQDLQQDMEGKFRYKIIKDHVQEMTNDEGEKEREKVNLVCFWSEERAKKDRADRERLIEKARQKLANGETGNDNRGCLRYVRMSGNKKVLGLDEEQIKKDAEFDGYYVIESSKSDLTASQVIAEYKRLWRIEDSFRVMKSALWTRPIFHWTPRRIKGHFVLCFIAFLLERTLERKLKNNKIDASPQKIRSALNSLQVSLLNIDGKKYYLKGKTEKLAGEILRVMKINQPKNLTPAENFKM